MAEKPLGSNLTPVERRRFLRESLRGSVPLLLDWAAGRARDLARLVQEPAAPPKLAPPPAAASAAPSATKENLDQQQEEFARDNPGQSVYPSS